MINISSNFARLFFIAGLSMTLAACTVNPPASNTGGGTTTGDTTGDTTGNTNTGGGTQTGGGTDVSTINPDHIGFVVQLTASVNKAKADQLANTFAAEGYHVIQNKIERNGNTLHRVQIGPYASKHAARAGLAKIKNRYQRNAYVRSAFVNENK